MKYLLTVLLFLINNTNGFQISNVISRARYGKSFSMYIDNKDLVQDVTINSKIQIFFIAG